MNCHSAQRLISAKLDGALTASQAATVDAHLAGCPACRAFQEEARGLGAALRARHQPAGPTPEAAWAAVQRELRNGADVRTPAWLEWLQSPRLQWAGAATMALALVVTGTLVWLVRPPMAPPAGARPTTEVRRLTTGLAGASTMVYEDQASGWTVVWVLPKEGKKHARK